MFNRVRERAVGVNQLMKPKRGAMAAPQVWRMAAVQYRHLLCPDRLHSTGKMRKGYILVLYFLRNILVAV